MSNHTPSRSTGRRPLRAILLVVAATGAVVAYRNAVADQGGTYDPARSGSA